MNKNLTEILTKAKQAERYYIGLMSGTSLDGLDVALCRFNNSENRFSAEVLSFKTYDFTDELKQHLNELAFQKEVSLEKITLLNALFGDFCGEKVVDFLNDAAIGKEKIIAIASHGQTLFHIPKAYHFDGSARTATLQIGDADHISVKTDIPTIGDFRQKHTAMGGEGAPLVGYLDFALFRSPRKNRILLNLGGIANLTFIPLGAENIEECLITDIGPANTLINQAMKIFFQKDFDQDGKVAENGKVHTGLLTQLHRHEFLNKEVPKSTGPEEFNLAWLKELIKSLKADDLFPKDIISTLTQFSSEVICNALNNLAVSEVLVSGGGLHNPILMDKIYEKTSNHEFTDLADYGIPPDAKEALLMAFLADSMLRGEKPVLGKISIP